MLFGAAGGLGVSSMDESRTGLVRQCVVPAHDCFFRTAACAVGIGNDGLPSGYLHAPSALCRLRHAGVCCDADIATLVPLRDDGQFAARIWGGGGGLGG